MKRILVLLVTVLVSVPLALGCMAGTAYFLTSESSVPHPTVTALNIPVPSSGYTWQEPVFSGLLHRTFSSEISGDIINLGELNHPVLPIDMPSDFTNRVKLFSGDELIWNGRGEDFLRYQFLTNGDFVVQLECQKPSSAAEGSGTIYYQMAFSVRVPVRYELSDDWISQGDVAVLRVYNLDETDIPTATSALGPIQFTPTSDNTMSALIPIGHDVIEGEYIINLQSFSHSWEISILVFESFFSSDANEDSNDDDDDSTGKTSDFNPSLSRSFTNTISPLLHDSDSAQHWSGYFMKPVEGIISTDYGTFRRTNQSRDAANWTGVSIEAALGSEIIAPATGRVVFASDTSDTGNTIILDHGGGLKSLLYYMDEIYVKEGDFVEKNDIIGTVGQTGAATTPHLHYEVRLWEATVNPNLLFAGTSELYHFE